MTRDDNQHRPHLADAATLPPVVDVPTAGQWLGIGRTTAYQLAKAGKFPVPVLRVGASLKVPTAPLAQLLGLNHAGLANTTDSAVEPSLERMNSRWAGASASAAEYPLARWPAEPDVREDTDLERSGRRRTYRGHGR